MDVPSGLTLGHLPPQTRLRSYVGRVNPLSLQLSYEPVSLQQILSPFCLEPRPHVSTMRPVSRLLLPHASEAPTWPWPGRSCLRPLDQQARAECRRLILTPAMIDPLVVDLPCSRTRRSHGPRTSTSRVPRRAGRARDPWPPEHTRWLSAAQFATTTTKRSMTQYVVWWPNKRCRRKKGRRG